MDDLNQQISQILSDPQSMKQIQDMAAALGLGAPGPQGPGAGSPAEPAPSPPPPAAAAQPVPAPPPTNPLGGLSPEMLQMASHIAPLLSQVNREDDATRLLHALRPLLSPPRQKKLDEAIKILHMMRLLPLLKESGLFSGLLTGLL